MLMSPASLPPQVKKLMKGRETLNRAREQHSYFWWGSGGPAASLCPFINHHPPSPHQPPQLALLNSVWLAKHSHTAHLICGEWLKMLVDLMRIWSWRVWRLKSTANPCQTNEGRWIVGLAGALGRSLHPPQPRLPACVGRLWGKLD